MGQFRPSSRSRSALYPARPHHSPHVTDYSPVPLLCFLFLYRSLGFVRLLFVESSPWLNCQRKWMQITKDHSSRWSSSTVHPVCNVIHSCNRKVLAGNYSDLILYIFRHVFISSEGALYVILPYDYQAAARPLFEHTPVLNNNFQYWCHDDFVDCDFYDD